MTHRIAIFRSSPNKTECKTQILIFNSQNVFYVSTINDNYVYRATKNRIFVNVINYVIWWGLNL